MSARSFRRARQRRLAATHRRLTLRQRRAGLAASAAIGATALFSSSAQGAPFEVTSGADAAADACDASCTLRDAVAAANANAEADTITFNAGVTGTIVLTQGEIPMTSAEAITINGPGDAILAISGDANNDNVPNPGDSRIFAVAAGSARTISGLTLTEGYSAGGGALEAAANTTVTLIDSAITDSVSSGNGGGIMTSGHLTLTRTELTDNAAPLGNGGAILMNEAAPSGPPRTLSITDSTIAGNDANRGAGVFSLSAVLEVTGSTISGNTAATSGGGISQDGKYASFEISNSEVSGNSAGSGGGGGVHADLSSSKYASRGLITETTISGNDAVGNGAGILIGEVSESSRLAISHSTISGNEGGPASFGGGIQFGGTVQGQFELENSTISGNTANVGGGVGFGSTLDDELIEPGGSLEVYNSTIASNSALTQGGGIYLAQYTSDSGQISALVPLRSTIVANNSAAGAPADLDRANTSTGGGFELTLSLVEAPGDAPLIQDPPGSSIVGSDPQLGPLADNGGQTNTHLPARTSPAIDKGDAPARLKTDQRGEPRTIDLAAPNQAGGDGTDIGSVELGPPPPDTTRPNTTIKKAPKKKLKTKKRSVKVTVGFKSEIGATFKCKVDKRAYKTCTSPFSVRVSSKAGKGRKHQILIRATDPAGNVEATPAKVSFKVIRKILGRAG